MKTKSSSRSHRKGGSGAVRPDHLRGAARSRKHPLHPMANAEREESLRELEDIFGVDNGVGSAAAAL